MKTKKRTVKALPAPPAVGAFGKVDRTIHITLLNAKPCASDLASRVIQEEPYFFGTGVWVSTLSVDEAVILRWQLGRAIREANA